MTFHAVDNDALLAYSKFDPITGDCVLVVANLSRFAQHCELDLAECLRVAVIGA